MRKILLTAFMAAWAMNAFAQNNPVLMLIDRTSDDELEYERYFYNDDYLMNEKQILYSDGVEAKEIYHYNDANLIHQLDGFQLLSGVWKKTYYIDYTYDADGNRLSRANYNSFGGTDFTLGGIYDYQYENGRRSGWQLTMMGSLVEQGQLFYDAEGRITQEIGQDNWSGMGMENSFKVAYTYNPNGSLKETSQYFWNGFGWDLYSIDKFTYYANGNCEKWEHFTDGIVTNKFEYEYDLDYTRDQLILPYSPEDSDHPFRWVEYTNKMDLSHWHTQNDVGQLIYICDFIYHYTELEGMGLGELASTKAEILIYPNPTTEKITISSENASLKNLTVTDMSGKVLMNKYNLNQNTVQLDVSHLNPGTYVVSGFTSKGVVSKRIVVK